jgi:protein TonB
MLKRANQFFLASFLVLFFCLVVFAQGAKTQLQNSTTTTTTNQQTTSDREQDGFLGPVRRVKTEVAKLSNKGGKFVEGTRAVLENAAYDMKGVKSEYSYYPNAVSAANLTGRETYKYDEKGNISEMTSFNADGSLAKKEIYTYEYDFLGNWTKMTTSVAVIEGGKISYEPIETTYRTISYYMDENVLKQMEAAQKNVPTNAANTNAPTQPQTQPNAQPATQPNAQTTDTENKSTASNTNHVVTNPSTPNTSGNSESKPANTSSSVEKKPADTAKTDNPNNKPDSSDSQNKNTNDAAKTMPGNMETPKAAPKILKPISGGVLNGKAVNLPMPEYPDFARRSRISGVVSVEVVIDEKGKVISAKAVSGPGMLQQAAVSAALRAKFSPTMLSGQAVKVTGVINYNFSLN